MAEINRRETDAQVLRLFFISTAVFIVIGAIVYGVFQTDYKMSKVFIRT